MQPYFTPPRKHGSRNLGTYYFGTAANEYDWTSPRNNNLWLDGVKTLFGPCPAGWRVPRNGTGNLSPWRDFGANPYAAPFYYYINGVKQTALGTPAFVLSPNNGRLYEADGIKAWYPALGYHHPGGGALTAVGYYGYSWSSTINGTNGYFLNFGSDYLNPSSVGYRGYGFAVRCVRE